MDNCNWHPSRIWRYKKLKNTLHRSEIVQVPVSLSPDYNSRTPFKQIRTQSDEKDGKRRQSRRFSRNSAKHFSRLKGKRLRQIQLPSSDAILETEESSLYRSDRTEVRKVSIKLFNATRSSLRSNRYWIIRKLKAKIVYQKPVYLILKSINLM